MAMVVTDPAFSALQRNPFRNNEPYGADWVLLKLLESAPFRLFTGGGQGGIFQVVLSKQTPGWQFRVMDFVQYETDRGNNLILAIDAADLEAARVAYGTRSYLDRALRDYEPEILVHTTTREAWRQIQADGCVKSWALLREYGTAADTQFTEQTGILLGA